MRSCLCQIFGYFPVEIIVLKSRQHFLQLVPQLWDCVHVDGKGTNPVHSASRRLQVNNAFIFSAHSFQLPKLEVLEVFWKKCVFLSFFGPRGQ